MGGVYHPTSKNIKEFSQVHCRHAVINSDYAIPTNPTKPGTRQDTAPNLQAEFWVHNNIGNIILRSSNNTNPSHHTTIFVHQIVTMHDNLSRKVVKPETCETRIHSTLFNTDSIIPFSKFEVWSTVNTSHFIFIPSIPC